MKPRKLLSIPMALGILAVIYVIATGPNPCDGSTHRGCDPGDTSSFLDVLELVGAILLVLVPAAAYFLLWAREERGRQQQARDGG